MMHKRTAESGKTSPIARPSPSRALKVQTSPLHNIYKSQSLVESRKSRFFPTINAGGQKTRHHSVLCIRAAQHELASPTEDLNRGRAIVYTDRYNSPGDHSPKASSTTESKRKYKVMSKYCLDPDSEMSAMAAAPEIADQRLSDSCEHQGDNNPSTPSLAAIVQFSEHVENPQDIIDFSSSGTGLDTTWPSWSSDKHFNGSKERKRYTVGQPKTSRQMTASLNGKFKAMANLAIKSKSSSPTKAPLPMKISPAIIGTKNKQTSSNIKVDTIKSLTSTTLGHTVDCSVVSRSASPVKKGCKITLDPQSNKNGEILLHPTDSWDSLSPGCNTHKFLFSSTNKNALSHGAIKQPYYVCEAGRNGSPDKIKASTSNVVSIGSQRLKAQRFENPYICEAGRSGSPDKIRASTSNVVSLGSQRLKPQRFENLYIREAGRSVSPDKIRASTSNGVSLGIQRLNAQRFGNPPSLKRKLSFSPSVMENVKAAKVKISQPFRSSSSNGPRKSSDMHLLKVTKTNRGDRSTDSGYPESVSRATSEWFTAMGLIIGERSCLTRHPDSKANVDSHYDPSTYFSNGSPLSTQTALYSIEEQNRSCHSLASTQNVHSTGDGYLDTSITQPTDESSVQMNQQNKTRCYFEGELHDVSSRYLQTSDVVGNSDQTFEQISESALTVELVEEELRGSQADNDIGTEQDFHSVVAESFCTSDTCGLVSDILDNDSDVTDISVDWDTAPPYQETDRVALKSSKKERVTRREAFQNKDPKGYQRQIPHKDSSLSFKGKKTNDETSNFELGLSPEISMREESSMQELSYSTAFLARGFNSNTRRTVEINYDLITMNDTTSRVFNGNTPTLSDGPASRVSQRSLSAPSRNPSASQSQQCKNTPSNHSAQGDAEVVEDTENSRDNIRSRLRLLTFSRALDHCCWSNMTSAIDRELASYCSADFPEPILFYLGCLFIFTMCTVLAFVLTYSFIG